MLNIKQLESLRIYLIGCGANKNDLDYLFGYLLKNCVDATDKDKAVADLESELIKQLCANNAIRFYDKDGGGVGYISYSEFRHFMSIALSELPLYINIGDGQPIIHVIKWRLSHST